MLIPAQRILDVIGREFDRVCDLLPEGQTDASSAQSISTVLRLLREREQQGGRVVKQQFVDFSEVVKELKNKLRETCDFSEFDQLFSQAQTEQKLPVLEGLWYQALSVVEGYTEELNASPNIDAATKTQFLGKLVSFEAGDLLNQLGDEQQDNENKLASFAITVDKLTVYLQDRFNESHLQVTSLKPLPGGFGKETIFFTVEGEALNGEFVMRRDIGENCGLGNDCHQLHYEYPVIHAMYEHGFPAPEVLWLDTEHELLPGSDFIIMRRAEGTNSGNFFGAKQAIPDSLSDALAKIMARLHVLPPVRELGNLNESINEEFWQLSRGECIERYIRGWYEFWKSESHNPSPALVSLYGWLLDNVPERQGTPSMIHGDIGFHNFLMKDDKISVVLDWEFAHVGDPAEELGYVKVTVGGALDWDKFMASYIAAGGEFVDAKTLHYFQVWGYVRNASGANLISNLFVEGRADDLKLSILPYLHVPHFINAAQQLIAGGIPSE